MNYGDILTLCYPHLREWTCTDGTYEGLLWPARVGAPKPTKADMEAAWAAYVPPAPKTPMEELVDRIKADPKALAALKAEMKK